MKYESKDQAKPIFEAKGIETVRRDQCALTQKILRNALVTLFQQRGDLTQVKSYLERQWSLILAGRLPVADFILTGRVRSRYRGGRVGPVQAVLARRLTEADPGRVVRHKERLPYVIVATPGRNFRLRDCVLTPMELLEQWDAYTIHSVYYITKHVNAALQRCLGLEPHFVNVQSWYDACPKPRRRLHVWPMTRAGSSLMISSYFGSDLCSLCGQRCKTQGNTRATVCASCRAHPVHATTVAWSQWHQAQQAAHQVAQRCRQCNLCFEDATTFATLKPSLVKKKQKFANDATTTSGGSLTAASWTAASRSNNPGIVVPLANCSCIDCPTTFERHRLREAELQAEAICQALDLF
jgi:DNA polymerase zeta